MLKNTEASYGSIAKWMHWLTAICFLVAYLSVYYRIWFLEQGDPAIRSAMQIHTTFGASVLVFVVMRVIWKFSNPAPKLPSTMPAWQVHSSHASHLFLYFFTFAMPISGWLGYGGSINFELFSIPSLRSTELGRWILETTGKTWQEWEHPIDFFHKKIAGAWLVWILVVIHAGAGLYHHFVEKDDVLTRMLPCKNKNL